MTKASFQSNSRDQSTRDSLAASLNLRGLIWCSWQKGKLLPQEQNFGSLSGARTRGTHHEF